MFLHRLKLLDFRHSFAPYPCVRKRLFTSEKGQADRRHLEQESADLHPGQTAAGHQPIPAISIRASGR